MDDDILEFQQEVKRVVNDYLKSIETRCSYLFAQAIYKGLYSVYTPKRYVRTYQLYKAIKTKLENDTLFVYLDTNMMFYQSAVTHVNVESIVPWLLTNSDKSFVGFGGHHDIYARIIPNAYHSYERRKYLEVAQRLIQKEFDVDVVIVNERPDYLEWDNREMDDFS